MIYIFFLKQAISNPRSARLFCLRKGLCWLKNLVTRSASILLLRNSPNSKIPIYHWTLPPQNGCYTVSSIWLNFTPKHCLVYYSKILQTTELCIFRSSPAATHRADLLPSIAGLKTSKACILAVGRRGIMTAWISRGSSKIWFGFGN